MKSLYFPENTVSRYIFFQVPSVIATAFPGNDFFKGAQRHINHSQLIISSNRAKMLSQINISYWIVVMPSHFTGGHRDFGIKIKRGE